MGREGDCYGTDYITGTYRHREAGSAQKILFLVHPDIRGSGEAALQSIARGDGIRGEVVQFVPAR